eukprot:m.4645 g.4645  ORF g.4645 m.4645 type:complete len:61 (+) comp3092_c0_seq2:767-949(+)
MEIAGQTAVQVFLEAGVVVLPILLPGAQDQTGEVVAVDSMAQEVALVAMDLLSYTNIHEA